MNPFHPLTCRLALAWIVLTCALCLLRPGALAVAADDSATSPPPTPILTPPGVATPRSDEILQLIRTNLQGVTDSELDEALVQGLMDHLRPRVSLVTDTNAPTATAVPTIMRTAVYDNTLAYIRVGAVREGLRDRLGEVWTSLAATNQLKGLILDLRFAGGTDYGAAAQAADLFVSTDRLLMNWGDGDFRATAKTNAIPPPIAILVNRGTSGAGEALAAALRAVAGALLVGSSTSGEAYSLRNFTLANGQTIRIASARVRIGEGQALTGELSPDISTHSTLDEERRILEQEAALPSGAVASPAPRPSPGRPQPLNEAELVRRWHQVKPDDAAPRARVEARKLPAPPVIQDPALEVAIDVLKGLALLQRPAAP